MRSLWILTLMLTILISIWFLPRQDQLISRINDQPFFQITVTGAVVFPKTLTFYEPVTYDELLKFVGGLNHSDIHYIPPTYIFTSTQVLNIPRQLNPIERDVQIVKININTASFEQLLKIPYMTETRAAELIIYRRTHGFFDSIESLIHVKYIGTATIENLRPYITTT